MIPRRWVPPGAARGIRVGASSTATRGTHQRPHRPTRSPEPQQRRQPVHPRPGAAVFHHIHLCVLPQRLFDRLVDQVRNRFGLSLAAAPVGRHGEPPRRRATEPRLGALRVHQQRAHLAPGLRPQRRLEAVGGPTGPQALPQRLDMIPLPRPLGALPAAQDRHLYQQEHELCRPCFAGPHAGSDLCALPEHHL